MIFKLTKWQLGLQILYCLSDFHFPSQPHNFVANQQRTTIVQAAKTHGAHVIVEDSFRYFEHKYGCEQQYIIPHLLLMQLTPKKSPLFGLSSLCYHAGVSATNVEFCTGICASYFEEYDTPSKVFARVEEIIKRIESYDDGPVVNAWYQKLLDEYAQFCAGPARSFLQQLEAQADQHVQKKVLRRIEYSSDMQAALECLDPTRDWSTFDSYDQKDTLLAIFNYKLLDAELIHALMQQPDKNTVFIYAGALHISNIEPLLEKLGYKKILSEGDDLIVKETGYKEPDTIPTNKLSLLLESGDVQFPFLLKTNFYIQSLLDGRTTNSFARAALVSLSTYAIMMGVLSLSPSCALNNRTYAT